MWETITIDVHRAGPTDALTARTAEGQGGVLLVLDLEESIEHLKRHAGKRIGSFRRCRRLVAGHVAMMREERGEVGLSPWGRTRPSRRGR